MSVSSFSRAFTASSIVAMISLLGSVLEVIEKLRPFARRLVLIWVNCLEDTLITHFFLSVVLVALLCAALCFCVILIALLCIGV